MELEQFEFSFTDNKVVINTTPVKVRNKSNKKNIDNLKTKYQELYAIYSQLYDLLEIGLFETREIIYIDNLVAYPDELQAEVDGTQFLDIDERIRRNKEYLQNVISNIKYNCELGYADRKDKTLLSCSHLLQGNT